MRLRTEQLASHIPQKSLKGETTLYSISISLIHYCWLQSRFIINTRFIFELYISLKKDFSLWSSMVKVSFGPTLPSHEFIQELLPLARLWVQFCHLVEIIIRHSHIFSIPCHIDHLWGDMENHHFVNIL